jgi:hypothetical protein
VAVNDGETINSIAIRLEQRTGSTREAGHVQHAIPPRRHIAMNLVRPYVQLLSQADDFRTHHVGPTIRGMYSRHTQYLSGSLLLLSLLAAGCGNRETPQSSSNASQPVTSSTPLVVAPQDSDDRPAPPVTVEAGGMPTTLIAHYTGTALRRITEERGASEPQHGEYEFQGARLLRYRGITLEGADMLELEFDAAGKLLAARKGGGEASEDDIRAIRSRASVLRSLALAEHATSSHIQD